MEVNPYDSLVTAEPENEYEKIRNDMVTQSLTMATSVAKDKDPNVHAKVLTLSQQLGAESSFVAENFEAIEAQRSAALLNSKLSDAVSTSPKSTEFLGNPDNLAVSKDDLDTLLGFEKELDKYSFGTQAYGAFISGVGQASSALAKTPAYLGNVTLLPGNLIRKALGMPEVQYEIDNKLSDYYGRGADAFRQMAPSLNASVTEEVMGGNFSGAGETLALQVLANAPQQIALIGATLSGNPWMGLSYAGVTTAADKASALQEDGVSPLSATSIAAAHGAIESAFETLGTVPVVGKWMSALSKDFGKQTAQEVVKNFSKTLVSNMFQEGSEEFLTSLSQDLTDYLSGIDDKAMQGSFVRALDAAAVGAASGGSMTAPVGVSAGLAKRSQMKQADINKNLMLAIADNANNSQLKQRLPEKYKEYVDHVTKDGAVENTYIDTKGFNELYQKKGLNPVQVAQELGISEQYNKAVETGNDIEIKTSDVASKMTAAQDFNELTDHMKFDPEQLTPSQAKQQDAESKQELEQAYEQAKVGKTQEEIDAIEASANMVQDDIAQQLVEQSAYTPKSAKQAASLWGSFFKVQGMRTGQDPFAMYKNYGIQINKGMASDFGQMPTEQDLYQKQDFNFNEETGEYIFNNVEANVQIRSEDMLNDLSPKLSEITGGEALEINTLEVQQDQQGQGLGSKALNDIEKIAYDLGQEYIVLKAKPLSSSKAGEANPKNLKKLIRFYQKNGFEIADKNKNQAFMYKKVDSNKFANEQALFQDDGKVQGVFRPYDLNKYEIILTEAKDESTFIHESAHFFMQVLADNKDKAGIAEDYKELLNWVGAESVESLTREQNEMLAEGFESYVMEGKAPSVKLKKAFYRFKTWMLSLLKNFKDVKLNDKVREVFDRMLATEEELAKAQEKLGPQGLFLNDKNVLTESEMARYQESIADAKQEADEYIRAKIMKDMIRKKNKDYKEAYNQIFEEEMSQAREMLEFKAIDLMKTDVPLGKEIMNTQFKEFKSQVPRGTIKEVGEHPDFIASMLGFENGVQMLNAIDPYKQGIDAFVTERTNQRMLEGYPDILQSPEISEEAIKAYHTDKAREVKRLEMEFLISKDPVIAKTVAKRLIKRMPTTKAIQEQAVRMISDTVTKEIKPHLYRSAEKKFAAEAAKAYGQGDFEMAFEAKRKEYLNFELYRAAVDAKEEIKKSLNNFKKVLRSDEDSAKTRDVDLVNAAKAILAEFNIGRLDNAPSEYLDKLKQYDPEVYTVVNNLVLSATQNSGDYEAIKFENFIEMRDAVMSIWDLAKSRKEIQLDGRKMNIDEAISELGQQLEKITPENKKEYAETITKWGIVKEHLLGAKASLIRAEHWAKAVDVTDQGSFWGIIFRPISDATANYRLQKVEVLKKYRDLFEAYRGSITYEVIKSDELGFMFKNKAELMMAILHSGNESNFRKLVVGRNWGMINDDNTVDTTRWDSFIDRMHREGVLTKADYDFAQSIWDLLETLKAGAQKAHKQMFGFYFKEITSNEFETPFGVYRGGYIPAKADTHSVEDAAIRQEREAFENNNNSFQYPTAGRGFTKSRVDNYMVPLSLDINLLGSHIDGVLRFINIEPRIKEVSRIVLDKGFRQKLAQLDSNVGKDMLVPWLQRAAQQKVMLPSTDGLGRMTDWTATFLRRNVAMQVMFANVTNTLQQFTGLVVAASVVKPKYLRNGLVRYITSNKQTVSSIMEKSDWMRSVQGENIFEIHQTVNDILLNPNTYQQAQAFFRKHQYFMQSASQNMVNNIVWSGAYEQSIENGYTEKQAVKEADSAVRRTQGTNQPEDVSRFETGTPTEMLFKQFVSYFNMLANLNASELTKISRESGLKKGAGKAFYIYLTAFMLPAFISDLIVKGMAGKFDDDDDDSYADDLLLSFFGSQIKTALAPVPYGGQAAVTAWNRFATESKFDDRLSLSPAINIIESMVNTPGQVYETVVEKGEITKKTTKDVLQFMGILTGLPLAPIGKPLGYQMDLNSGKATAANNIDYARGLITGKTGQ